jgi:alpha-tubulin suppressor-like RCC1 family protein
VYQPLQGDGQVIARVASIQNTNVAAKAGVMIRETLATGSKFALMSITPGSGAAFVYRTATDAAAKTTTATGVTAPQWVKLVRTGSTLNGYRSPDGITWTLVKSQSLSMASTVYVGLAVTSKTTAALCTSTFDAVSVIQPWLDEDYGTVGVAGRLGFDSVSGTYSTFGAGTAIGGTADHFHFVHQARTGDGQIVVRLRSQQNAAAGGRAGIMFRTALTSGSQNVSLLASPNNDLLFQSRSASGGATTTHATVTGVTKPTWLKLVRAGNVFSAYRSLDGLTWQSVGSQTVSLASAGFIGYAVCSGNTTGLSQADMDNVIVGGVDTDNDNLPDSFETTQFGGLSQSGAGDFDHDGLNNLDEFLGNSSPSDYYNGLTPSLTKISGDEQVGAPSAFVANPLVVEVKNPAGQLQIDAPVMFSVIQGGGLVSLATSGQPLATTIVSRTDSAGRASIYYQQGAGAGVVSVIRASANGTQTDFSASTAGVVATPTITPDGGTFATQRNATVTCTTPGSIIRYTFNGVDPTETDASVASGGTIRIPTSVTLRMKAFKNGWTASSVKSSEFTLTGAVAAGNVHTLALTIDGHVYAWGSNYAGQLGNGTEDPQIPGSFPPEYEEQQITPGPVLNLSNVMAIAAGEYFSLALKEDGTVWRWGFNYPNIPEQIPGLTGVTAIAGQGTSTIFVLKNDGTVWQVDGTPTQIISGVKALAAGPTHRAVVKTDGTVWCWGQGTSGQLGNGRSRDSATPVQASGLTGAVSVACGDYHTFALKADGSVWGWGSSLDGQLGNNSQIGSDVPIQITTLSSVVAIAGGYSSSAAVTSAGTVLTFGDNHRGRLGSGYDEFDLPRSLVPIQFAIYPQNGLTVDVGWGHSVAVLRDGTVRSSGYNEDGELGNGNELDTYYPVTASNFSVWPKVDAPAFSWLPQAGSTVNVTITSSTIGAEIHYTLNGQDPTTSDPLVPLGGVVNVASLTTLKARAWFPNMLPSSVTSALISGDLDGDGLSDLQELALGTNPAKADSDGDGMSDAAEVTNGTDPRVNNGFNDPDQDGLTNEEEALLGTNPNVNDLPGGSTGLIKIHTPLE